jgi:release factor glutamine methyltransferase
VDNSAAAVALARENVALIQPRVPVDVVLGDLVEPLRGRRWHLIVSNPPYLSTSEYALLDPIVRDYEPMDALVSGADGLETTRRILSGARDLVEPDGVLALEIDERRAGAVQALGAAAGWSIVIREDLFGKPRYAFAVPKEEA